MQVRSRGAGGCHIEGTGQGSQLHRSGTGNRVRMEKYKHVNITCTIPGLPFSPSP